MNKLEVGMFVRYKYENCIYIGKIKFISEVMGFDEKLAFSIDNCMEEIYKENIIKSSHNTIDLIEEGDIVITPLGEIIQLCSSNIDELKDYWKITNNPIKSILTKEQFESMEYSVE